MAYKKPIRTSVYINAYPLRRTRIKIPQNPVRPINIHKKDLIKREILRPDASWYIEHRRGIKRPKIGEDPLEARAISKDKVKGTLPERIVYKFLVDYLKMTADIDFDFQSSQDGGRLELGGLVADFLFFYLKIVIQVQGPTHSDYLRGKKDEEQRGTLESMGYSVFDIEESTCYNEFQLEEWMRRVFGLSLGIGSSGSFVKSPGIAGTPSSFLEPEQSIASEDETALNQVLMKEILSIIIILQEK